LDSDDLVRAVERAARTAFAREKGSHDFGHVERVLALCERVRRKEGGDPLVLSLAALLHDMGRLERYRRSIPLRGHGRRGAIVARRTLARYHVEPRVIEAVVHCIEAHSFRSGVHPETIEAKILFDADKLDSIGAIGVGRAFLFAGEIGAIAHNATGTDVLRTKPLSRDDTAYREYLVKLRYIKDRMQTREGRRLARARHAFMKSFFVRLLRETAGRL
jgi:uncharacterized protein